ncbi:hypothetical protein [uncultured Jannaschia sp.]|uniref:hypothetical protein n=1 Tax=uncultured Jannaschia sp. TaxID=293347 RepID=UPI0026177DF6|nr:hypothetical protein [uncultured Jannaschia sp.]
MPQTRPEHIVDAEFTRDMVETLSIWFEHYATGGVVTVEVTTHGLWLRNPYTKARQFLGRADVPDEPVAYRPAIDGLDDG